MSDYPYLGQGRIKPTAWKVWFKVIGESKWVTAAKEWNTKEEATAHALGKFMSWTATEDWTVTSTGVDPNNREEE